MQRPRKNDGKLPSGGLAKFFGAVAGALIFRSLKGEKFMRQLIRWLGYGPLVLVSSALLFSALGCEVDVKEGPGEEIGESVDEATEDLDD